MSLKIAEAMLTTPQSGDSCPLQRDGDDTPYRFDPSALGGSGLPLQLPIQDGRYYPQLGIVGATDVTATSDFDGLLVAVPFVASQAKTWTRIGIGCGTGDAGIEGRLGIYRAHATTGLPDELVVDAGTVDLSSDGEKEIAISEALSANTLYWLAFCAEASMTATINYANSTTGLVCFFAGLDEFDGSGGMTMLRTAHAFGALPDPFPTPEFVTQSPPVIWLRTGV
jgi:hypothetical protein